MTYAHTSLTVSTVSTASREFRTSVFEVAASVAERAASALRSVAERSAHRAPAVSATSFDQAARRSQAPPGDARGRAESEAVRMQRLL
jgi:hypothetical protein